ncbi:MAG TPA: ComEC/Rec2 family competence protein [Candidatus Megaira endosymbiont of Nemacystus decipiens]|nr:ComEC/Rec2 family competence protein [Candidatus Megaera endosymbiont of Nemacystus decipiens]
MLKYLRHQLEINYSQISLWYFLSFALGIVYFFTDSPEIPTYLNYIFLVFFIATTIYLHDEWPLSSALLALLAIFFFGIIISEYRASSLKNDSISKEHVASINGVITEIKPNTRGQQITIDRAKSNSPEEITKVRINLGQKTNLPLSKGQLVSLKAKLFPLGSNILPNSFDFGFYLKMLGIQATGYALTKPKIIASDTSIYSFYINQVRDYIYDRLIGVLGKEKGNFAAAIIIGQTKAIPKDIADNMRLTGIAHILSVSGLHLSLVALIFFATSRMLLNLSNFLAYKTNIKLIAASVSIIGSFLYLQISGNNIAATRAFIMTSIFMVAIMLERCAYPIRSVLIAAFFILLFLPEYVLHPSFQLSFIAVLCLISGYELYGNISTKKFNSGIFGSLVSYITANIYTSLLASLATAPYVIFHFYKFANYSPVMNLIAVPLMSFCIMPLSIFAIILMLFGLETKILKVVGVFIQIILDSSSYVAKLPYSVLYFGSISPFSLLLFTFGFCWLCFWQSAFRYFGCIIVACSVFLMLNTEKPQIIIDKKYDILSVYDQKKLTIYSRAVPSGFIRDYWESWYGVRSSELIEDNIWEENKLLKLSSGETISLNYTNCIEADLMIITGEFLNCSGNHIIKYHEIKPQEQIVISARGK